MQTVPLDLRRSLLRQYGDFALAYSATVQRGLEHFGDESGFLSYRAVGGTALALADPVAPPDRLKPLLSRFVEEKGDVCFWQTSRRVAETLSALGFLVNEMGVESHLDLSTYSFSGRAPVKRNLRRARGRAFERGYTTRECPLADLNPRELEAVSTRWRRTRPVKNREMTFLTRPVVLEDEPDVRKFFTFDLDGQLIAFSFFDPVYDRGEVIGYLCSAKRRLPEADSLVSYAQLRQAMEAFRREGKRFLFLGLSPLAQIEDKEFACDRSIRGGFKIAFTNPLVNRFLCPLQQLARHKGSFGGATAQTYYACNRRPRLPRVAKVLRACALI